MNALFKVSIIKMVVAALSASVLLGCEAYEQEQAVLSVVREGVSLIEQGQIRKTMKLTTRDFLAHPGRHGRTDASKRLLNFFRANGDIDIMHPEPVAEVKDSGDAALVTTPFVVARRGADVASLQDLEDDPDAWEAAASEYTDVHHAEISLVKRGDRWLVRSIRF